MTKKDETNTSALNMLKDMLSNDMDFNKMKETLDKLSSDIKNDNMLITDPISKIDYKILAFTDTEVMFNRRQDLHLIESIDEIDSVYYIFIYKSSIEMYVGSFDVKKGKLVLNTTFLNKINDYVDSTFKMQDLLKSIISKVKKKYDATLGTYKKIISVRTLDATRLEELNETFEGSGVDISKTGYKTCEMCKLTYPKCDPYFSQIGYENGENTYLNICRKCELVRYKEETLNLEVRDKKAKLLKLTTMMSVNDILNYDLSKISLCDLDAKLAEKEVVEKLYVNNYKKKCINSKVKYDSKEEVVTENSKFDFKFLCVEKNMVFNTLKEIQEYFNSTYPKRVLIVLDDPKHTAFKCHWRSVK